MLIKLNLAGAGSNLSQLVRIGAIFLALAMSLSAGAEAQIGLPLNRDESNLEPVAIRELVARYCRLDYSGARLIPSDWPKMQPIVAWPTNPDYSLVMITSRFDVEPQPILQRGKYLVTVHYRLLGKYDVAGGYIRESANRVQDVEFVVAEVNGEWRITDAEPNDPHPSRAAAMQWLNTKLAETQDPALKAIYQHALQDLQSQTSSPFAR